MLELVPQEKTVKWDSKHDLVMQGPSSSARSFRLVCSDKLPAVVKGGRKLLKPMFQKSEYLNCFSHQSRDQERGKPFSAACV